MGVQPACWRAALPPGLPGSEGLMLWGAAEEGHGTAGPRETRLGPEHQADTVPVPGPPGGFGVLCEDCRGQLVPSAAGTRRRM